MPLNFFYMLHAVCILGHHNNNSNSSSSNSNSKKKVCQTQHHQTQARKSHIIVLPCWCWRTLTILCMFPNQYPPNTRSQRQEKTSWGKLIPIPVSSLLTFYILFQYFSLFYSVEKGEFHQPCLSISNWPYFHESCMLDWLKHIISFFTHHVFDFILLHLLLYLPFGERHWEIGKKKDDHVRETIMNTIWMETELNRFSFLVDDQCTF